MANETSKKPATQANTNAGDADSNDGASKGQGNNRVMITLNEEAAKKMSPVRRAGEVVGRTEFIRNLWAQGLPRGDIRKVVNSTVPEDKQITYQIVFAAVKGQKGGPAKSATPAPQSA